MKNILVLDIETDGLNACWNRIVEIGAVLLNTTNGAITNLFGSTVFDDHARSRCLDLNAWVFQNTTLLADEVLSSPPLSHFFPVLDELFQKYPVVAYNMNFDISFLKDRGFHFPSALPCPMLFAAGILRLPGYYGDFKWPKVQECLDFFGIDEREPHRALEDARLEAQVIYQLIMKHEFLGACTK